VIDPSLWTAPDQKTVLPASTSSQHLTFTFRNGCVANLRGSGTEPKLKYYVELHGSDKDAVTAHGSITHLTWRD
jgi:phosphomannomutase